jgi:hypothetical protein
MGSREHRVITSWTGFCASCPVEQPLLLVETGPHGLRGWLAGAGAEDRTLSYACAVCGRVEQVPLTEEEDARYDATLVRWPDWVADALAPLPVTAPAVPLVRGDVFGMAALQLALAPVPVPAAVPAAVAAVVPAPRPAAVRVVSLPTQRVSATDVLAAAA